MTKERRAVTGLRMRLATTLAVACLAGCARSEGASANPASVPTRPTVGRFEIVPVTGKDSGFDHDYWYAWLIDTQTGELKFCTMDSGNLHPTVEMHELGGLSCTLPAT